MLTFTGEKYGTLEEIAGEMGLQPSSLRAAVRRYPKDFDQMVVGLVGATKTYRLSTVQAWHASHNVRGRPKKKVTDSPKPKASSRRKTGKPKA